MNTCSLTIPKEDYSKILNSNLKHQIQLEYFEKIVLSLSDELQDIYTILQELFPCATYTIHITNGTNDISINDFCNNHYIPVCDIQLDLPQYTPNEIKLQSMQFPPLRCRNNSYLPHKREDILRMIDINNPATFLPILQMLDYPYLEEEWQLCISYAKCPEGVLPRYINLMRLKGYIGYGFADGDDINTMRQEKLNILNERTNSNVLETSNENTLN